MDCFLAFSHELTQLRCCCLPCLQEGSTSAAKTKVHGGPDQRNRFFFRHRSRSPPVYFYNDPCQVQDGENFQIFADARRCTRMFCDSIVQDQLCSTAWAAVGGSGRPGYSG